MSLLDDPKFIKLNDPEDALGVIDSQHFFVDHDFQTDFKPFKNIQNIVVAGMGGSALAAALAKSWLSDVLNVPMEIVRDYDIPSYVSGKTLFIVSSYSGNTEETLSALNEAEGQKAQIAVICNGGKLSEIASKKGYSLLKLPNVSEPRYAVLYGLKALAVIFEKAGLAEGVVNELSATRTLLEDSAKSWGVKVLQKENQAKQLAKQLHGKIPIIYSGPVLAGSAYKWKISFNENAKQLAFWGQWPEFNHNEFIGWTKTHHKKNLAVVELQSSLDHPRLKKRFQISNDLLSSAFEPIIISADGESFIEQIVWTMQLGDYVSIYAGLLKEVDPTPVALVEELKSKLRE